MTMPNRQPVLLENIPDDLRELAQWGLWRQEQGRKIPYQVNGRRASSTDPSQWSDFEPTVQAYDLRQQHWDGLSFFFHVDDPFAGIDLDNCIEADCSLKHWARGIVERFFDTYMEISPSGRGIKMWCRGRLPAAIGKVIIDDGGIEAYDRARFFTVTGQRFRGAPLQVEDHASDVIALYERLTRARRGAWQWEPNSDGKIPYGKQHLTLVSIAGTLRRRGVCDAAVEACLQAVNRHQCEKPGLPANITRIVSSSRPWRQLA